MQSLEGLMKAGILEDLPPHNHLFTKQVITIFLVNITSVPVHSIFTHVVSFSITIMLGKWLSLWFDRNWITLKHTAQGHISCKWHSKNENHCLISKHWPYLSHNWHSENVSEALLLLRFFKNSVFYLFLGLTNQDKFPFVLLNTQRWGETNLFIFIQNLGC